METNGLRRNRRRGGRALLAACLVVVGATTVLTTTAATAAPMNNSQAVSVASGQLDLGGFKILVPIPVPVPVPIVLTDLEFEASAQWTGDITTNVGWDGDFVRQGQNLDISRSAPATSGNIKVTWTVKGKADGIPFGPSNISKDNISCTPALLGGGFSCDGQSGHLTLAVVPSLIPFTTDQVWLDIGVSFDVTPEGAVVHRAFTVGGTNVAGPPTNPDDLGLVTAPSTETFAMPCTAKPGDSVAYDLSNYHWTPDTTATQQARIRVVNASIFAPNDALFDYPGSPFAIGPANVTAPPFDLTGSGFLTDMGALLANNVSPTIGSLGPFSGTEGSPISFSASVDSQCPIGSYVWEFSNGTKSFGPTPQRAFGDNGTYDGELTVTDITGLSATQDFTVNVSNAQPSVNAGPDTTADWGRLVAFNGQATDPGWDDQSTLQYTWTFGDGTPSASGGPSVLHAYSLPSPNPGDYVATLTVCDKDTSPPSCPSDSRQVIVTKRETALGYTGPLSSSPSKTISLKAHLVDEYGEPVSGRKVNFSLGAQTAVGTTDSSGNASINIKLNQKPGSYPLSATFAGDSKYLTSADAGLTFVIGK
jgi:hypothetical protein